MSKKTLADVIAQYENLKPYDVYIVWQTTIDHYNIDRTIVPQMAYNYDRNGLIVKGRSAKVSGSAGRYTIVEVCAFVSRWMIKNYKIDPSDFFQTNNNNNNNNESTECDGQMTLI